MHFLENLKTGENLKERTTLIDLLSLDSLACSQCCPSSGGEIYASSLE